MVSCAECISANQPTNRQSTWMPFRMPATYGRRLKLYIPISFPPSVPYTQHCEAQIATDEKMSPPLPFRGREAFSLFSVPVSLQQIQSTTHGFLLLLLLSHLLSFSLILFLFMIPRNGIPNISHDPLLLFLHGKMKRRRKPHTFTSRRKTNKETSSEKSFFTLLSRNLLCGKTKVSPRSD